MISLKELKLFGYRFNNLRYTLLNGQRGKVVARERGKNWLFPFFFLDRMTRATPSGFLLNINSKLF
jgi:hypothetical protein